MDINLQLETLLVLSKKYEDEALRCLASVDKTEQEVELAKQQWDDVYNDFISEEGETPVPGGGKWNDKKRLAYVVSIHQDVWSFYENAKRHLREATLEQRIVAEKISALNRTLRVYEIAVTNNYNKGLLMKLGVIE